MSLGRHLHAAVAVASFLFFAGTAQANKYKSPWPAWWYRQAMCIHQHEGAWNDNTGNSYFGGMQFLMSTWTRAGGGYYASFSHQGDQARYPFTASPREQLLRAYIVWKRDGGSWREWGTAGMCGLR